MLYVLNLSERMRRRAAPLPSARRLLIRRLPLSSDMLSSDGAHRPRRDVCAHQNQMHLLANAIICQTAGRLKTSSCCGSKPSMNLRCYPRQPAPTVTEAGIDAAAVAGGARHPRWELMSAALVMTVLNNSEEPAANQSSGRLQLQEASSCDQVENMIGTLTPQLFGLSRQ